MLTKELYIFSFILSPLKCSQHSQPATTLVLLAGNQLLSAPSMTPRLDIADVTYLLCVETTKGLVIFYDLAIIWLLVSDISSWWVSKKSYIVM